MNGKKKVVCWCFFFFDPLQDLWTIQIQILLASNVNVWNKVDVSAYFRVLTHGWFSYVWNEKKKASVIDHIITQTPHRVWINRAIRLWGMTDGEDARSRVKKPPEVSASSSCCLPTAEPCGKHLLRFPLTGISWPLGLFSFRVFPPCTVLGAFTPGASCSLSEVALTIHFFRRTGLPGKIHLWPASSRGWGWGGRGRWCPFTSFLFIWDQHWLK